MAGRSLGLTITKWLLAAVSLFLILWAVLFFGRQPLLVRWLVSAPERIVERGMSVTEYEGASRSGVRKILTVPGSRARLEKPNTFLEAFGIWDVRQTGTVTLNFRCDDHGEVYIDGHLVIGVKGIAADNRGQAVVPLTAGPHLLVVRLVNGPGKGSFALEALGPGGDVPVLLSKRDLRPLDLTRSWSGLYRAGAWVRTAWFWAVLLTLLLLTLGFYGAETFRQGTVNTGLFLGGCLLAALVGEGFARLFFEPPQAVFFREKTDYHPQAQQGDNPFIMPTERGYRHRPNTEVTVTGHPGVPGGRLTFRTNSIGYRNREIGPKTGKRILFLGDSITFGLGMPEEFIFVRLVEDQARRQGKDWETVNSAVGGLGLNAELAVLTETGLALQPDLVVLDFYLNDFQESPGIYLATLPGLLNRSRLAHQIANVLRKHMYLSAAGDAAIGQPMLNTPKGFPDWLKEFKRDSTVLGNDPDPDREARTFHDRVVAEFIDWGGSFSPRAWGQMEVLLRELDRLARRHRFELLIAAFPVRYQVEAERLFDYPQRRLGLFARELQVPFLDLLPVFRAEYARDRQQKDLLFYDNCHLSVRGHQVTARALYDFLKRHMPEERGPAGGAGKSGG